MLWSCCSNLGMKGWMCYGCESVAHIRFASVVCCAPHPLCGLHCVAEEVHSKVGQGGDGYGSGTLQCYWHIVHRFLHLDCPLSCRSLYMLSASWWEQWVGTIGSIDAMLWRRPACAERERDKSPACFWHKQLWKGQTAWAIKHLWAQTSTVPRLCLKHIGFCLKVLHRFKRKAGGLPFEQWSIIESQPYIAMWLLLGLSNLRHRKSEKRFRGLSDPRGEPHQNMEIGECSTLFNEGLNPRRSGNPFSLFCRIPAERPEWPLSIANHTAISQNGRLCELMNVLWEFVFLEDLLKVRVCVSCVRTSAFKVRILTCKV